MSESSTLAPKDLTLVSEQTIAYYEASAASFWEGTRDHDVSQNVDALLRALPGEGPHHILDFGCGPGRDLLAFKERGQIVSGLDGCAAFCEMARSFVACEVYHQDFLKLSLPHEAFDGIFANASLFHVPSQELPRVLSELHDSLREGGVLFSSNPRGANQEGWNGERYGAYYDLENWRSFMSDAGFEEVEHYYRPPGMPRAEQPWLASVYRRSQREA